MPRQKSAPTSVPLAKPENAPARAKPDERRAPSPEGFYERVAKRPDVREILRRLAK